MVKILVCGGRDYLDYQRVSDTITDWCGQLEGTIIIQGEAKGADFLAKCVAHRYNMLCESYPADWKRYGRAAGAIRNQQMLDEGKPDLVIAMPGGSGTADMVRRSKNAGIPVVEVGDV